MDVANGNPPASPIHDCAMETAATGDTHSPGGDLEAGVQIGDFRIERRLGAGGMGIVYQARQLSLNRRVALKVLGHALNRSADITRFQREAQAAARLRHPAIAQVYYIGQDRHLCYMAMELIDGVSLRRVLDRLGTTGTADTGLETVVKDELLQDSESADMRFDSATAEWAAPPAADDRPPPTPAARDTNPYLSPKARELRTTQAYVRRCAEVVKEAAAALSHAHVQGVVHRDIKPDNLLLDRDGTLHLIDFGVARFFEDQAVTCTGQLVGTPLYMSPEQVTGRGAVDARTDLYSLGLVLYELVTLRPPLDAANREHLLRKIITKPLVPVVWRNQAVPDGLARIIHKATQKDPDQRYATAELMAADLDRFLSGQSVAAPQYHYRLDEREITAARPSRVVVAGFITFLVTAVVSLGIGCVGLMTMFITDQQGALVVVTGQLLAAGAILGGGIFIGHGMLSARAWARWTGVCAFVLLSLASAVGLLTLTVFAASQANASQQVAPPSRLDGEPAPPANQNSTLPSSQFVLAIAAMYALPVAVGLVLGAIGVFSLVTRPTREWFAFANQLRLEHRSMKKEFE
jgi:serine/threonine protein kinase